MDTEINHLVLAPLTRRQFVIRAGAFSLAATSLAELLDACQKTIAIPTSSSAPTVDLNSQTTKIRHLLRRAGFGASDAEIAKFTTMGLAATTDYLIEYQNIDDSALESRVAQLNIDKTKLADISRWWLIRMIYTQRPLLEKMTLFWHGLLTSAIYKVTNAQYMFNQNQLFRSLAFEDYGVLLKAVSRDPAMLVWLDNRFNKKSAPNENYARELMELFSLGIGNYGETDVRESARAFTGWGLQGDVFFIDANQHDSGTKIFLGQTGNFTGDDIIDIIMKQPAAAQFIATKLFEFFAYPNPEAAVVSRLANVFTSNNRSIKAVVRSILTSDEFYSDKAFRTTFRSPSELVPSTIRVLGVQTSGSELIAPVSNMGQTLFNPPDVSGWKGGMAWINSNTLLSRINFANQVATARGAAFKFNPADLLSQNGVTSSAGAVDYFISLLLDGSISSAEKDLLSAYVKDISSLTATTGSSTSISDEELRSLVYLILSSPDYQLA